MRSGAFPRELRFRARDVTVYPQPCTGLVEAIEAGDFARAGDVARGHVAALLARLPRPQSAVLGCTHYPLVEAAFRDALPPETALVSQPALVADSLADYLARHPRFRGGTGAVSLPHLRRPRRRRPPRRRLHRRAAAFRAASAANCAGARYAP